MYQEIITQSPEETFALGKKVGSDLIGGEILALVGDLGSGKTTFIQGLAQGLGITDRILSPTFILMRSYKGTKNLYHLDLYRLEDNIRSEITNLGISDLWEKPDNIVVIEWADKAVGIYPSDTIWIYFKQISDHNRKITIKS